MAAILAYSLLRQAPAKTFRAPSPEYLRTLKALEEYRILAAEDDGAILPETEKPVEPGDQYDGVPRLIRLLTHVGDLPAGAVSEDSKLYQSALVAAVQQFQSRHGLEPHGRIDKATLAQLNIPLGSRIHQLELAVERWRRPPFDPSRPAIVLNLPEFRLRAYRANRVDLEMKIIVGQAPEHKTPVFSSEIKAVIFRPFWDVPLHIQRDELISEIMRDRSFLSANHLEMVAPQGGVVHEAISTEVLAQLRSGRLRLRQTPGPKNVLGLAKFVFPNTYEIYMHDTSAPWLFTRLRRDLSHGCIRVERARDLAEWVLQDEPGWTPDRIARVMHGSESLAVGLSQPIQVVAMYVTAVVLENGEVHFFQDIYGEDKTLGDESSSSTTVSSRFRPTRATQ